MISNEQILKRIRQLVDYATENGLLEPEDRIYANNTLIAALGLSAYEDIPCSEAAPLEEILSDVNDFAFEKGGWILPPLQGLILFFGSVPGAASSFRGLTAGLLAYGSFRAFAPSGLLKCG